jgi:hypothetical protein
MSIEFVGSLVNASANNSFARSGGSDADYPSRMARLHEESGFDRLLAGHSSSSPDGFTVADTVLNATRRLGVLFKAPGLAMIYITKATPKRLGSDISGVQVYAYWAG